MKEKYTTPILNIHTPAQLDKLFSEYINHPENGGDTAVPVLHEAPQPQFIFKPVSLKCIN